MTDNNPLRAPTKQAAANGSAATKGVRCAKKPSGGGARTDGLRIALYSHDTMGIGHVRRNLLIGQSLIQSFEGASALLIAGAKEAGLFDMPHGLDCLTLPSLCKDATGQYQPRHMSLALKEVTAVRSAVIFAALKSFRPDVFVVDKVPHGVAGELVNTLAWLRDNTAARCVLGLRDVLDDRASVLKEWEETRAIEAMDDDFDAIWVYGDARIFDAVAEYSLPPKIAAKARFTGYLDQCQRMSLNDNGVPDVRLCEMLNQPFVLCVVGGGQDGGFLARSFVDAVSPTDIPAVLVTGPHMPRREQCELLRIGETQQNVLILGFVPEVDWLIQRANRVVCMGGYNTLCSMLSFEKRALVVPRISPRLEQSIRAQRLQAMGLVDVLPVDRLNSKALRDWLTSDLGETPRVRQLVDLNGLSNICRLVEELMCNGQAKPNYRPSAEYQQRVS